MKNILLFIVYIIPVNIYAALSDLSEKINAYNAAIVQVFKVYEGRNHTAQSCPSRSVLCMNETFTTEEAQHSLNIITNLGIHFTSNHRHAPWFLRYLFGGQPIHVSTSDLLLYLGDTPPKYPNQVYDIMEVATHIGPTFQALRGTLIRPLIDKRAFTEPMREKSTTLLINIRNVLNAMEQITTCPTGFAPAHVQIDRTYGYLTPQYPPETDAKDVSGKLQRLTLEQPEDHQE